MMDEKKSFGFSIKKSKNVENSQKLKNFQEEKGHQQDEVDFVKSIDHKGIKGTKEAPVKKQLIIPCPGNMINFGKPDKVDENGKPNEDLEAEKEILEQTEQWRNQRAQEGSDDRAKGPGEIPLSKDLTIKAEVSTLEDYEEVPVEGFGLGMLRGMGFKPGEGIGGFKKQDVKCIEPQVRPKGLGLGASRPNDGYEVQQKMKDEDGKELVMKKGAHVQVFSGPHKSFYGKVEGRDGDSARVFIQLAVGGENVSVSENSLKLVPKSEYKKYCKVINKDQYDQYEEKQKIREKEWSSGYSEAMSQNARGKLKKRKRSRSPSPKESAKVASRRSDWVRPYLRVRIIDKHFKSGKYFNSKVVIEDVVTAKSCTCRTEDNRYLENLDPMYLETIIPKQEGAVIMILRGKARGRLGKLISRDKKKYLAVVQLLPDGDELLKLDFDDICEYKGEILDY